MGPQSGVLDTPKLDVSPSVWRRKLEGIVFVEGCPEIFKRWGFDAIFNKDGRGINTAAMIRLGISTNPYGYSDA
jgi:hypothetical protein